MANYSSRQALLGSLIDYAGTFPPAALPLEKALIEAVSFRRKAHHPWLLSKIVVTIGDLKKLSPRGWFDAGSDGAPLPLTVIGSAVEKTTDFERTLGFELRELRRFNEKFYDSSLRQRAVAYEARFPDACPVESIPAILKAALNTASGEKELDLDIYIELPLDSDWQSRLARTTQTLAEWNEGKAGTGAAGFKIRTGGKITPSPDQLSEILQATVTQGLRFKATQGLHHPISKPGDYGFVNLFGALCFAHALGLEAFDTQVISKCLQESDKTAFRFEPDSFSWLDFRLTCEQIESARRRHAGTFGSCSLDEPDEFLQTELG